MDTRKKKSNACKKVLRLMDEDYTYTEALKKTLSEDMRLSKRKLERELSHYI